MRYFTRARGYYTLRHRTSYDIYGLGSITRTSIPCLCNCSFLELIKGSY